MDDKGSVRGVILLGDRNETGMIEWDDCPGLLLPLANTPIVERILTEYARAGIRETLIAAGLDTGEIAELCGDGARWDMTLVYQDDAGDAPVDKRLHERVRELAAFTKNAPFLVTPGALLLESKTCARLVQSCSGRHPSGVRVRRPAANTSNTPGNTAGTSGCADGNSSIYLMTPRIYEVLNNGEIRDHSLKSLFDAALDELIARGETVLDLEVDQPAYGVGSPEVYLDSNERWLASNERLLASAGAPVSQEATLPEIMADNFSSPNLVMRPPVLVEATAELERCRIGPGVCIGPGARIGHGAAIEHSVIMADADIGDGASISHAVIGQNASIENRSVLHGRKDRVIVVRSH